MSREGASAEFREAVHNWSDNTQTDVQLVYLASGVHYDAPSRPGFSFVDGEPVFLPSARRWLAVYGVSAEQGQMADYVVMVSDGQAQDLRSWTVSSGLVDDYPDREYFEIPGPAWSDNVIVPYRDATVMGGIGTTAMEMTSEDFIFSPITDATEGTSTLDV